MSTQNIGLLYKGLSGGTTSERTPLNVLPTVLEEDSRNVEVLRDTSLRPRRGVDFIGQSDLGNYMYSIRTLGRTTQDSPSGIYVAFRGSDGSIVEKHIVFIANVFKIFDTSNLTNMDAPTQTIDPSTYGTSSRINTDMHHYSLSFSFGENKVFFAGRKIQPGYLWLDDDNTTLNITFLSIHVRDFDNATAQSSRVTRSGKYYECVEAHTSAATDVTNTNIYGELTFNRYWMELDNTSIPGGASAWSAGVAYTTNITKPIDKFGVLATQNPHRCRFWNNRLLLENDTTVYVSKIGVNPNNLNDTINGVNVYSLFLQEADPFNTSDPDVVASDGVVINIASGKGYDLEVTEDSIFIGTSTKIYEVRGDTSNFKATDFKISEVINEGINGCDNMVNADNKLYVFGTNNIWGQVAQQRIAPGSPTVFAKIANKQIKDYYRDIPKLNKGTARVVYSATKEKLYYFHNSTSVEYDELYRDITGENGYARSIMIIDISNTIQDQSVTQDGEIFVQGQVELWEYEDSAHTAEPYIAFAYSSTPVNSSINNIVIGGDQVVIGSDNVVIVGQSGSQQGSDELVVIALERSGGTIKYSLGVLESANLKDWESDATRTQEYSSVAHLGTQTMETTIDVKQVPYCVFIFETMHSATTSCLFRSSYDFAAPTNSGESTGRTSDTTEIYQATKTVGNSGTVASTGFNAVMYKKRILGRGKAFQPTLENTPGKDFKFLGWGQLIKLKRR